jgi:hypothetical protein
MVESAKAAVDNAPDASKIEALYQLNNPIAN